jgi:hypothetical protein
MGILKKTLFLALNSIIENQCHNNFYFSSTEKTRLTKNLIFPSNGQNKNFVHLFLLILDALALTRFQSVVLI